MLKKIFKSILGTALFFTLFTVTTANAESLIHTEENFQIIKIQKNDLNRWIKTPYAFTSIAIKSKNSQELKAVFNPQSPVEKDVIFDDDAYSELIFTNPTKNFLITAPQNSNQNEATIDSITVYLFNTQNKPETASLYSAGSTNLNGLKVISRSQWGADENLRYYEPEDDDDDSDGSYSVSASCKAKIEAYPEEYKYAKVVETENGNYLTWPLQYSPEIKKIVVHHTGETKVTNGRPSDEMMRAIYYYHTVVKGWGDIGYHYVIGRDGEIYEGKSGGDKVVGAHVYCNNIGTMGVSVMGNFELEEPSTKQINSLKAILSKLTQNHNLQANVNSNFHGKSLPNVIGHRDLAATACPGKNLHSLMPTIRQDVAKGFTYKFTEAKTTASKKDYDAEVSKKVSVLKLNPTHQKKLTFRFKNTGKQSWNDETWLHVSLNNNTNAWADSVVPDKKFVAADLKEKSVKPGKTGTFEVTVNAGYNAGFYILEFAPVVNNKYKLSSSAILQPIDIPEANYTYNFIKAEHPPNPFYAEQPAEAWVELKNTGNIVWRNYGENKIYLGTANPQDRKSLFSTDGRRTRVGYLKQREVKPGQTGRFVMPLTAPERRGIYKESFAPVIEGIRWLEDKGMQFRIIVKEPKHQIQFTTKSNLLKLDPDTKKSFTITYQNLSDVSWTEDQIYFMLAGNYRDLGIDDNVIPLNGPLLKDKKGSFKINLQTPVKSGLYNLTIVPVIRGKKFEDASPFALRVIVKKPNASGTISNNVPKTVNLDVKESDLITIKIKNTGNITWYREGENATSLVPISQRSRLYVKDKWVSQKTVCYLKEESVKPGKTGTFSLYVKPKYKGYYNDVYKIKINGLGLVKGVTIPFRIKAGDIKNAKTSSNSSSRTKSSTKKTATPVVETPKLDTSTTETTTEPQEKNETDLIRVLLTVPETNPLNITADKTFVIINESQKKLFTASRNQKTIIKKVGNYLHVQVGSTNKIASVLRFIPNDNGIIEISNWDHQPAWNQDLNDNRFRGTIELRIVDGKVAVINELPLEDYLKGIAEVSNTDPVEKLRTMAVLSRTYALFYMQPENEKFPEKPYDASDDPAVFQKYLGYGLEIRSPNFVQAIEDTKNEVVTYNNELVKTPYFNQSDGKTLSAEEVWGWTHTPYLKSVEDPACNGMDRKGHGVGLSGYGATQMAKNGKNYKDIIKYYYQKVEIEEK